MDKNRKNYSFLYQSIANWKLYKISKNQSSRALLGEEIWDFFHFLILKKADLPISPLQIELGTWNFLYADVVGAIDLFFGRFDFSDPLHPLTAPKSGFLERVFLLFEFVLRISSLQIELEGWNLECRFSRESRCAFWEVLIFQSPCAPYTAP